MGCQPVTLIVGDVSTPDLIFTTDHLFTIDQLSIANIFRYIAPWSWKSGIYTINITNLYNCSAISQNLFILLCLWTLALVSQTCLA